MWNSRTFEGMEKYVIELKICFLCVLLECCTIGGAGELLSWVYLSLKLLVVFFFWKLYHLSFLLFIFFNKVSFLIL